MKRVSVFQALKRIVCMFAVLQVLTVAFFSTEAKAEFAVPNCKTLAKFGLDYFNYKNTRIKKVFGSDLMTWRNAEIKAFVKGFKGCRQHFAANLRLNFDGNVALAANDLVRKINQHHKRQKKLNAKKTVSPKVAALLKKYPNTGPGRDFLTTVFRTYAGAATTGDVATVIEFFDRVEGERRWKKIGKAWVLIVDSINAATGNRSTTRMVFQDLRSRKTYIWLDSVTINGQSLAPQVITYMVRQMFH